MKVAPGESARLGKVTAFGPSPAVAHVVSLRSTPCATAPLLSWNRVGKVQREWLHLTPDEQKKVKGSNIDRFNSFPTEVCEME